ncbi:hypothetical protein ACFWAY_14560 [Rhodococcus sp. NPDC059968]
MGLFHWAFMPVAKILCTNGIDAIGDGEMADRLLELSPLVA